MDLITDVPESDGMDSIVVFTDKLTKMIHIAPTTKTSTARDIALLFLSKVWALHGMPKRMLHDRDTRFTSNFWTSFFALCGIKQLNSSAFHPQTDGQTERVNRVVEDFLRHFSDKNQSNWPKLLPFAEFAFNNAKHDSTGYTPFYLNYGYHPAVPGLFQGTLKDISTQAPAVLTQVELIQNAIREAKLQLQKSQDRQKQYADKSRRSVTFTPGEAVLLSTKNLQVRKGTSKKMLPRFIGPFKITKMVNEVAARLDLPTKLRLHPTFHVSLLRKNNSTANCKAVPLPEIIEGELEYEVEDIVSHRSTKQGTEYLIKWRYFSTNDNTWEPESNLGNSQAILKAYKARIKTK